MKKIFTFLIAVLLTTVAWAQAPQKISYQAVVRNSTNQLVTSHSVGMKISILQGSTTGTLVYTEIQTPTTNANGLVSVEIGGGAGFDTINWATGPYFIKTETDPTGGTNYSIIGTSEFLSVPYALYSLNGTPGSQGIQGATGPQGDQGIQGAAGATGPQGVQGNTGAVGPTGATGADGATGSQGITGTTGATGSTGPQGIQGVTGNTGSIGATGATGAAGLLPSGAVAGNTPYWNGTQWVVNSSNIFNNGGSIGIPGLSTPYDNTSFVNYNGLVFHTYNETGVGTVSNIISTGNYSGNWPSEIAFHTRILGGTLSEKVRISNTGNLGIGTTTPMAKLDVHGASGSTLKIVDGNQGVNKVLGDDGTGTGVVKWISTSSLVGATGATGSTGPQGIQGVTGNTGAVGAVGATGPTGTQGIQGTTGVTGAVGATGATGAQGIQGATGATGADGSLNAWGLTGNAGTTPGTNFIGTTDDKDLVFKRNGWVAGVITTSSQNTSLGVRTMGLSTSGMFNTAIGYNSLPANSTGNRNSALGTGALWSNTTGSYNTGLGMNAINSNSGGSNNTAAGNNSLLFTVSGNNNTALGSSAGSGASGMNFNNCTFIGANSTPTVARTNVTMLGYGIINSQCTGDNQVIIGDTNVTSFIVKGAYKGTSSASPNLVVDANGQIMRSTATHYLGEEYLNGIIYYLYIGSDGQQHGLIVSKTESTGSWSGSTLVGASKTSDGSYNTTLLPAGSTAKTWVASLGAGWYLPSIDELSLLWQNRYHVNNSTASGLTLLTTATTYWSSTESNSACAYNFSFDNGYAAGGSVKTTTYSVRAVRAF